MSIKYAGVNTKISLHVTLNNLPIDNHNQSHTQNTIIIN